MAKKYKLLGSDGKEYLSSTKGIFGGHKKHRLYGTLDCPSALLALSKRDTYKKSRVFFASEEDAIEVGYRPCARCLKDKYKIWKNQKEK